MSEPLCAEGRPAVGAIPELVWRGGVEVYRDHAVTVLRGDGLAIAAELEDASIDAVVTDPPYCTGAIAEAARTAAAGQGRRSENLKRFGWFTGDNMTTAGLAWSLRSLGFEASRFLRPQGSLLVFMDWRMVPTLVPAMESGGLRYQNLIVWDKGSPGLGTGFRATHELVAHFTNGEPVYHDRSRGNVLRHRRVGSGRLHQTEKPLALLGDLIAVVTPVGGTVFDPYAGSGATGEAAAKLGCLAILVEREAGNCAVAATRLSQRQLVLESAR